jgi:type IV pilus assembly protein PilZ
MTNDNQNTPGAQASAGGKHGILSLSIKEVGVLYSAYMPFVENGGLFIPTRKQYELGDEVFVLLNLMDEPERIPLAGTVIWITPPNAQANRAQGIGIQFNDKDNPARAKIEKYLTGMLNSGRVTHTL